MSQQTKPVTGSNEHHAEIEQRLASLEANGNADVSALRSRVSSLEGSLGTANTTISQLQNSVSILITKVDALQRTNPAG